MSQQKIMRIPYCHKKGGQLAKYKQKSGQIYSYFHKNDHSSLVRIQSDANKQIKQTIQQKMKQNSSTVKSQYLKESILMQLKNIVSGKSQKPNKKTKYLPIQHSKDSSLKNTQTSLIKTRKIRNQMALFRKKSNSEGLKQYSSIMISYPKQIVSRVTSIKSINKTQPNQPSSLSTKMLQKNRNRKELKTESFGFSWEKIKVQPWKSEEIIGILD